MNKRKCKLPRLLRMALPGILAGAGTGAALIPFAYTERGYFAIGGEWILIISAAVLTAYAVNKFYKWYHRNFQRKDGLPQGKCCPAVK